MGNLQIVKNNLAFTVGECPLLRRIQNDLCSGYAGLTRQRAATAVLPALAVQCNMAVARELANDHPVSLLVDGVHQRRGAKFEAYMGEPFCQPFACIYLFI